jgi:hypothetical protein
MRAAPWPDTLEPPMTRATGQDLLGAPAATLALAFGAWRKEAQWRAEPPSSASPRSPGGASTTPSCNLPNVHEPGPFDALGLAGRAPGGPDGGRRSLIRPTAVRTPNEVTDAA